MNPDAHRPDHDAAAGSGAAAASSPGARRASPNPPGTPGAAAAPRDGGTAAPDLSPEVAALVRREAQMFDAVGAPIARPPADIQCRLRFFHRTDLTLGQIAAVLRSGL